MITDKEWDMICENAIIQDEYKFGKIGFVPDVIYDIGADVGSMTMVAHKLFPESRIIAVEPNPISYPKLVARTEGVSQITPVNAAVGHGIMYEPKVNDPLHWMVVGENDPSCPDDWPQASVPVIGLDELYATYGGKQYVVKMDCESAEYGIVTHPASREVLINSSYFAAEFHYWGRTHNLMMVAVDGLMRFLFDLAQTHTIYTYSYGACQHVWAKHRDEKNSVVQWSE